MIQNPLSVFVLITLITFPNLVYSGKFQSKAVDDFIKEVSSVIKNQNLKAMFQKTFPNTLDTTVNYDAGKGETFVITGDIPAMWLRDSTNQVAPYIPLINQDPHLKDMLYGLLRRQVRSVLLDTYANAFTRDRSMGSPWSSDRTAFKPGLWERKYELDSLGAVLRLTSQIYKQTKDREIFNDEWLKMFKVMLDHFETEQKGEQSSPYRFQRYSGEPIETTLHGTGTPVKPNTGLIRSAFRPSDDSCIFQYFIPANAMVKAELEFLSSTLSSLRIGQDLAQKAGNIAKGIQEGIMKYAIFKDSEGHPILAYEVDGYGSRYMMDDANVPSLLALPYLGYIKRDDPLYLATRKFVWSWNNPYWSKGNKGEGIGGPHIGLDHIWPMSIAMRALTSDDDSEIKECLKTLISTTAGTNLMHESFHKDNDYGYTRSWFAWANSMFGELVGELYRNKRHILENDL